MATPSSSPLSRRRFLAGGAALAGAAALGACGKSTKVGPGASGTTTTRAGSSYALAQFFGGPMFVAGRPFRAPFGVADADGLLPPSRTPAELEVQLVGPDGTDLGGPITVPRHADGLPRAYFPLLTTVERSGIYSARTTINDVPAEMQFQVNDAKDVKVIQIGQPLPHLETPTTSDARGVKPICTREPVCPLHDVTVAQAIDEKKPVALLVASPAFCQIAICGPVLDVLLDVRTGHPTVRFIHAEVYADPAKDLDTYAPAIEPLGLHFEPCLVLADTNGNVVDRVDTIFDRSELRDRLSKLA